MVTLREEVVPEPEGFRLAGARQVVYPGAISFVIALNVKHAFDCSQNSAISFVIALPGNNASAIMKLTRGVK